MQASQPIRRLLTALEVQDMLHIDRSTVYRMAEDGRLPAIRVGRSWRFPAERITSILADRAGPTNAAAPPVETPDRPETGLPWSPPAARAPDATSAWHAPAPSAAAGAAASAAIAVAADLLGVMMVVTDMTGRPITDVVNPCPWFAQHGQEPDVLAACIAEWRDLADHPDLIPRFQTGVHGFECARAFIRRGPRLVGMVLAGGVSPLHDPATDPDLFHLDSSARDRVLQALPRVAAAISTASTVTKEN
jgi:excisionase family DNA binding protein